MPAKISGICTQVRPILQKNSGFKGHFAVNDAFVTGSLRKSTFKNKGSG